MTYVEFLEKDAIENVCSCLSRPADEIILIGDKLRLLEDHKRRYEAIFARRGITTQVHPMTVDKNNLQDIVTKLSGIVEQYEDCVFDLTGGEDLYLVAMGVVYARYPDKKIQMHHFNIRNNTVKDCDQDGNILFEGALPALSIDEYIRIYGGKIVYEDVWKSCTRRWPETEVFKQEIDQIWDVCKQNPFGWNYSMGLLAQAEHRGIHTEDGLTTVSPGALDKTTRQFLQELRKEGILTSFTSSRDQVCITYKNEGAKSCLTKAGQALELKIWRLALDAHDKNGNRIYQDVMNGVVIDWDGEIHSYCDAAIDITNEIDVLLLHGMVPVFVSCKNGHFDVNELYKLNTVATNFGGKYAKKALFTTTEEADLSMHLIQRAQELGIQIIPSVHKRSDQQLQHIIRRLWNASN